MRVMVFMKATEDSEKGVLPPTEAFEAMDLFTEKLVKAGVMLAGAGLKPSAQAKRVAFDGPSRTVIDGPFAEARNLIAGFYIWQVKDMDEAVAWDCPAFVDTDDAFQRGVLPCPRPVLRMPLSFVVR